MQQKVLLHLPYSCEDFIIFLSLVIRDFQDRSFNHQAAAKTLMTTESVPLISEGSE